METKQTSRTTSVSQSRRKSASAQIIPADIMPSPKKVASNFAVRSRPTIAN
jgi:hypothetical protein